MLSLHGGIDTEMNHHKVTQAVSNGLLGTHARVSLAMLRGRVPLQ